MGRKPNKFKRGQKVMLTESYWSYPKMSAPTKILPGRPLKVIKTFKSDSMTSTALLWVLVANIKDMPYFDLPIPESLLVPYTKTGAMLYEGQDSEGTPIWNT